MNSRVFRKPGLLLMLATCIGLAACAGPGLRATTGGPDAARAAQHDGHYARAAQLYAAAARNQTSPAKRDELHMQAATAALEAQQADRAEEFLAAIDAERLNAADQQQYKLLHTLVRIDSMPPQQALDALPPPAGGTPPQLAAYVWKTRATLLFEQYKYIDGIHELVQRSVWLLDDNAIEHNNRLIFKRALEAIDLGRDADSPAAEHTDTTTLGWLRLAAIKRHGPSGGPALQQALQHWENNFTGHPATAGVLRRQFNYQPFSSPQPRPQMAGGLGQGPIVLALPLSGDIAQPAEAIRAGFEMAHAGSASNRSLEVIDSTALSPQALLQQARNNGAALLVGPLQKDKVAALARQAPRLPVLALNQIQGLATPPWFYRYALAPEDDARTAATHAADHGWHAALALVPEGDWGNRVLTAFENAFAERGGHLLGAARFETHRYDHKAAVQAVLRNRHAGGSADFMFIAARPTHARLLRSQLRFYRAGNLPVIATANIYSGLPEPRKDDDLDGVEFAAVPWQVSTDQEQLAAHHAAEKQAGDAAQRFPRLFAMGIDAWQLANQMAHDGLEPGVRLQGTTGELVVEPNGRIRRYLAWARFDAGRAHLVSPAPSDAPTVSATPIGLPTAPQIDNENENDSARQMPTTEHSAPNHGYGPVYTDERSHRDTEPAPSQTEFRSESKSQQAPARSDYGPVYADQPVSAQD